MREWWIELSAERGQIVEGPSTKAINVVEKSAYDALAEKLEAERRGYEAHFEKWHKQTTDDVWKIANLTGERDQLRERLEAAENHTKAMKYSFDCTSEKLKAAEAERDELKTERDNRCEELAEALSEVGQDVSNCYDWADLVGRLDGLVHECEVEKVEIERDQLRERVRELEAEKLGHLNLIDGISEAHAALRSQLADFREALEDLSKTKGFSEIMRIHAAATLAKYTKGDNEKR